MERKSIRTVLPWALVILAAGAGYWVYESHLSRGFKQVLVSACEENAKPQDPGGTESLEKAKAAVRTRKDRIVLRQFEHLVEMRKDVGEYDSHIWDRLDADLTDVELATPTPFHHLLALRGEYMEKHQQVPESLQVEIARATQEQEDATRHRHQQERLDQERTDKERTEIPALLDQIRTELGLSASANRQ